MDDSILGSVLALDRSLFEAINVAWTNPFFDWLFPLITDLNRDPLTLLVLLPLIAWWMRKKRMAGFRWLLLTLVCVGLSDLVSYRIIKSSVGRDRPEDSGVSFQLRTPHHSGSSFPSNHAANVFAAATALSGALPPLAPVFYISAALVAYSRIYVGVHFPLDVLGGALIGILISASGRAALGRWLSKDD